jgi:hypothetical protein
LKYLPLILFLAVVRCVTGLACGSTCRTRPFAVILESSVRAMVTSAFFWSRTQHLSRDVEHGVPAGIARDREYHLPGLHHLAGFRCAAVRPALSCVEFPFLTVRTRMAGAWLKFPD